MNIDEFLLKSDKLTLDHALKSIEHNKNNIFQANIYSVKKFIRYNSICNKDDASIMNKASSL